MSNEDKAGPSKQSYQDDHPPRDASIERAELTPSPSSKFQGTLFRGEVYCIYSFECINKKKEKNNSRSFIPRP